MSRAKWLCVSLIGYLCFQGCGEVESAGDCQFAQSSRMLDPAVCLEPGPWLMLQRPVRGSRISQDTEFSIVLDTNGPWYSEEDAILLLQQTDEYVWMDEYHFAVDEHRITSTNVRLTLKFVGTMNLEDGQQYILSIKQPSTGKVYEFSYEGSSL
jgi:hypothetical protein